MMHRYPENTETTADIAISAINSHGDIFEGVSEISELWRRFSDAARKTAETKEPDWSVVKALWVVADACSLGLKTDDQNNPFVPLVWFQDRRSVAVEDFEPSDVAIFSAVSKSVEHRELRARLADLAWILSPKRDVENARRAIDAYVEIVPNEDDYIFSIDEWRRAIVLCKKLRGGAEGRLERISKKLIDEADAALRINGGLGLALAQLIFEFRIEGDEGPKLAELLALRGESLVDKDGEFWRARVFLGLAAQWFSRLDNRDREADMIVKAGESFEKEADARIASDPATGHLAAQSFLGDALQMFRKVRSEQRPSRKVEDKLYRISHRLSEVGSMAVKSIQIHSEYADITDVIEIAENAVSNKGKLAALVGLAKLHSGADFSKMNENAESSLKRFVFSRLAGSTHISSDGRIIAKTPADNMSEKSNDHDEVVFAKIMDHYRFDINFVCQGLIIPAWRVITSQHTITKSDIYEIVVSASIVPPDRVDQFVKGLLEGFYGDFSSAIYLLAPQVECLTRWHLKQVGARTINVDQFGIENELGLSTLVGLPELKKVFDEDTIFEMRALFCSPLGPNLRNAVAHGLLNAEEGRSVASIYAWWWVLRLVLKSCIESFQHVAQRSETSTVENKAEDL